MQADVFLSLVLRLASGIMAIQAPSSKVSHEDAVAWATAAAYHAVMTGVDPFELVAIARNETDFRPGVHGRDGKDCGITQIRVTYSKYKCQELKGNVWLAFEESAAKLREYRRYCERRHGDDVERCRLNAYNSGYRYATAGRHGGYWLRVSCFADAARHGVAPRGDCRRARSREDIARIVRPPARGGSRLVAAGGSRLLRMR